MSSQDPPEDSTSKPYWDGTRWQYPSRGAPPRPQPQPVEATRTYQARPRSHLVHVAVGLLGLVILGSMGSVAVIAIRNHHAGHPAHGPSSKAAGSAPSSGIPSWAPSAQDIFELPYTKGIRSARFRQVQHLAGSTWIGSGVIEFAPEHAFSESVQDSADPGIPERDVEAGGVAYQSNHGSAYNATNFETEVFHSIGWDGNPAPNDLDLTGQTKLDGQRAWVLQDFTSHDKWVVAERTGDPLKAVIDVYGTFTFSDWNRAPAIQAPATGDISTELDSGSGGAPVVAPAATVKVLTEQDDSADGVGDPPGFRTVALEISYKNNASAAHFDDDPTLVSSDGVFTIEVGTRLSPSLNALDQQEIAAGQTITGWDAFLVPEQATSFHLLFGEMADQAASFNYLISIAVQIPA